MATYYYDPLNGNNANSGASFALAKKDINNVTPAGGDEHRVKSTPPAAMSVTGAFTNLSRTVTLSSAVNQTIDDCGTAWTAAANVTQSQNTTAHKEGSACQNLALAAGFTTGLVAYKATGTLNLSGYQQITFWIQTTLSSVTAGQIEIKLCSDTAGATPVNTFSLPALAVANNWAAITIDLATNLGSAIESVALYETADLGAHTVVIDNIVAVKASGNQDSLSLNSLITKNSTLPSTDGVYAIKSISGTTIIIDQDTSSISGAGRGYSGTTETVTLYKIEPFKTTMTTGSQVYNLNTAVSESTPVTFSGGWSSESTQDGVTFFSGQSSKTNFISLGNSGDYYVIDKICGARYNNVISTSAGTAQPRISNLEAVSCNAALTISAVPPAVLTSISGHNNLSDGLSTSSLFYGSDLKFNNNTTSGLTISSTIGLNLSNVTCKNNGTYGLISSGGVHTIRGFTSSDNTSGSINSSSAALYLYGAVMGDTVVPTVPPIYSHNHQGVVGDHLTYSSEGNFGSEATIVRTAGGKAWYIAPVVATKNQYMPLARVIATIYCVASKLVTVSAYPYRTNTGLTMKLAVRGRQIAGVDNDVTSSAAAGAAGSYEASPISLSFTPTQNGVVQVEVWAYGGTTYTGYLDDMTITST